jgi:hypothetical protein
MADISEAKRILQIASQALHALDTISAVIVPVTGLDSHTAQEIVGILKGVEAVTDVLKLGLAGSITPEEVESQLSQLHAVLAANDAASDAALRDKFPGG